MKARLENDNITTYRILPLEWKDEKGLHLNFRNVADPTKFGFYDVVTPSYDSISQRLGELKFDKKKKVFTYSVSDIDYTTTYEVRDEEGEPTGETLPNYDIDAKKLELIKNVKEEANRLLSPTDWYILRKAERSVDIPSKVATERGSIITKAAGFETEINALTTYESLLRYSIVFFPVEL